MTNIKTILHPTDFSEHAKYGFQLATALARDYNARLLVIYVEPPPAVVYGEFGTLPPEPGGLEDTLKKQLMETKPKDESIVVEHYYLRGEPAEEIVRFAEENNVELIVMGTHGRKGLSRFLMGSVAETVVRKASCPVLTLKTPLKEAADEPSEATST